MCFIMYAIGQANPLFLDVLNYAKKGQENKQNISVSYNKEPQIQCISNEHQPCFWKVSNEAFGTDWSWFWVLPIAN